MKDNGQAVVEVAPELFVPTVSADLLDAVAGVDQTIAALAAVRAQMISGAYDWITDLQASKPTSAGPSADRRLARDILIAELAALLCITGNAAAHLVHESRMLATELPATLEALGQGQISYRHATTVIDNADSLPAEARAAFEVAVLPAAHTLNTARFRERARRVRERTHPESLARRRAAVLDRRAVAFEPGRDGMAWLSAYLPAEQAIAIDDRLDRLAAAMRSAEDPRTFAQLRADAFCELMVSGELPGRLRQGIRAQVLVTVPVLTLLGLDDEPASLEGYGPIPAEVARLLAADAPSFIRLLTHPETGAVLSVGRDRYSVPADMRLFLRARDETCRGIGCGRRAATSDVDHGHAWAEGGTTSVANLAHLCRGDHSRKHRLGWQMQHLPGGTIRWISPFGRTYLTEPSTVMRT